MGGGDDVVMAVKIRTRRRASTWLLALCQTSSAAISTPDAVSLFMLHHADAAMHHQQ